MPRRVSLPGADELFRPTQDGDAASTAASTAGPERASNGASAPGVGAEDRGSSGRVRHDAKMTVYVTDDELFQLEHARLGLRRQHGIAVDRGRLVREAVSIMLADLDEHGDHAEIVSRLARS